MFVKIGYRRDRLKAVATDQQYRNLAKYFVIFTRKSQSFMVFSNRVRLVNTAFLSQFIGFYVGRHVLLIHSYGYADCGAVKCGERLITLHIKSFCRRT